MKFEQRTKAPSKSSKYYYSDNIFYKCGYGMPNCTAYAYGRVYELLGSKPKLCTSNAENWYDYTKDGYERGKVPKLGAVIVWSKGKLHDGSDGKGHVAIVEKINEDGSFVTSNSGGSTLFYKKTIPKSCEVKGYKFEGFIYPPYKFDEEQTNEVKIVVNEEKNTNLGENISYKVQKGDNLTKICKKYYGKYTKELGTKIVNANKAKYKKITLNYIQVGWTLVISK